MYKNDILILVTFTVLCRLAHFNKECLKNNVIKTNGHTFYTQSTTHTHSTLIKSKWLLYFKKKNGYCYSLKQKTQWCILFNQTFDA